MLAVIAAQFYQLKNWNLNCYQLGKGESLVYLYDGIQLSLSIYWGLVLGPLADTKICGCSSPLYVKWHSPDGPLYPGVPQPLIQMAGCIEFTAGGAVTHKRCNQVLRNLRKVAGVSMSNSSLAVYCQADSMTLPSVTCRRKLLST